MGHLTQSVFLLHPTRVITGTTTGKLVLWDCKTHGIYSENPQQRQKEKFIEAPELTRQTTKPMLQKETTQDTFKSSTSTRSGTFSSRRSSAKPNEIFDHDDEENHQINQTTDNQMVGMSKIIKKKTLEWFNIVIE